MRTIGKILVGLLASVGFIVVLLVGLGLYAASHWDSSHKTAAVPDKFVLTLNLDKTFIEGAAPQGLNALRIGSRMSLQDAVLALKRAKDDPRVVAIAATINDHSLGLAQAQEVRDLIAQFRAGGKPVMEFSESIGEGEGALSTYYLASAFGDLWVQPSGSVGVAGIAIEQPFLRKLLDRIGVQADVIQRKEYKSAAENVTNEQISPANKEELTALLGSWYGQMVSGIAADRKLSEAQVTALIDKGPLLASEAKEGGLIDHIGYRDEFEAALKEKVGGDVKHLSLARYAGLASKGQPDPKKTIAVINAIGEISRGGSDDNPLTSDEGVKSQIAAKAIRDAAADNAISAIVIRVDSPGGSYVASDTIWREVVRAKTTKKPIVVSMGNTAASGGYFIAMAADRIFAEPATVTGSIGVLTGKLVVGGISEKLDIHWDRIAFGESAGLFSSTTPFNAKERARMNEVMDAVYADFTTKAAEGRGKPVAELEKNARGRVWSGSDALKVGLVDELGGLSQAIDYTKTQIGLVPTDRVLLVNYPAPKDSWEKLFKAFEDGDMSSDIVSMVRSASWLSTTVAPLLHSMTGVEARGPQLRLETITVE